MGPSTRIFNSKACKGIQGILSWLSATEGRRAQALNTFAPPQKNLVAPFKFQKKTKERKIETIAYC